MNNEMTATGGKTWAPEKGKSTAPFTVRDLRGAGSRADARGVGLGLSEERVEKGALERGDEEGEPEREVRAGARAGRHDFERTSHNR